MAAQPKAFEYNRESILAAGLQRRLNALGKDGWELVTAIPVDESWVCIFKREAQ